MSRYTRKNETTTTSDRIVAVEIMGLSNLAVDSLDIGTKKTEGYIVHDYRKEKEQVGRILYEFGPNS